MQDKIKKFRHVKIIIILQIAKRYVKKMAQFFLITASFSAANLALSYSEHLQQRKRHTR